MRLPDFIIVGAPKCGTTAAHFNLKRHPKIHMAVMPETALGMQTDIDHNELCFFTHHWDMGVEWYSQFFENAGDKVCGEKSPTYSRFVRCHRLIAQTVPDAKILFFMREPVSRAWSNYWDSVWRLQNPTASMLPEPDEFLRDCCIEAGMYAAQWLSLARFFPRDRMLHVVQERVLADMPGQYNRIFAWLGVEPLPTDTSYSIELARKHLYPDIPPRLKAHLMAAYARQVEWLRDILDDPFEEWALWA